MIKVKIVKKTAPIQSEKTFHKQQGLKLMNGHPVTLEQVGKNKA